MSSRQPKYLDIDNMDIQKIIDDLEKVSFDRPKRKKESKELEQDDTVYVGGVILWVDYGVELKTLYVLDCVAANFVTDSRIFFEISYINMHELDSEYKGPVSLTVETWGLLIEDPLEIVELVKTSQYEKYQVINVEYEAPHGWVMTMYGDGSYYTPQENDVIEVALYEGQDICELLGLIADGNTSSEFVTQFLQEKDIPKVFYCIVDLKKIWQQAKERFGDLSIY